MRKAPAAFAPRIALAFRRGTSWCALLSWLAVWLWTAPARADLESDVIKLQSAWSTGARVKRLAPRLVERGEPRPVPLPPGTIDPNQGDCVTVAVLGAVSATFVIRFLAPVEQPRWHTNERPQKSVAGAAQLVRCGAQTEMFRRMAVQMRSPRGIVEIVVAQAAVPLSSLRDTLPHRDPGPSRTGRGFDPKPRSSSVAARARAIVERNLRHGAADIRRSFLRSGYVGAGGTVIRLDEGCHGLDLLGVPTPPGAPRGVDVDIDLLWAPSGKVAASDHSSSADASATLCVGRTRMLALRFTGSAPRTPLLLLHARWPLPGGLPQHWGPRSRALMAEALRRHYGRDLGGSPIYQTLGVTGVTTLPIEVQPGACYVATVATIHGEPRGMALAATVGGRRARNHSGRDGRSTAVAFCAPASDRVRLQVQAQGNGVAWLLGVWQTAAVPIGEAAE